MDHSNLTAEQLRDAILTRCWEVVSSIVEGGGEQEGVGESLSGSLSMTAATETYWGSSGRGNPKAASNIRLVAERGYLRVVKSGRGEKVSLTAEGLAFYRNRKRIDQADEARAAQDDRMEG